jgi:hypothetical protein
MKMFLREIAWNGFDRFRIDFIGGGGGVGTF